MNIPDLNFFYLSLYTKIRENFSLGLSFRKVDLGEIQFGPVYNFADFFFVDRPIASDLTLAWRVREKLSLGVSLRHTNSIMITGVNAKDRYANSVSGDVSLMYRNDIPKNQLFNLPLHFSAGLHLSNIGPRLQYDSRDTARYFLPTNLRLGWAVEMKWGSSSSLTFSNDFQKLLVPLEGGNSQLSASAGMLYSFADAERLSQEWDEIIYSFGMAYNFRNRLFLRSGYFHENKEHGNRQFVSFGLGFRHKGAELDFSYYLPTETRHQLQNTWILSLGYDFSP